MPPNVLLRRLLLLPLLAPLLTVLLVGALNPRPWVGLRLLIWRTPEWTIGSWLALAAGGGGALSATATALALQAGSASTRRQLHRPIHAGGSRRVWPWGRGQGPSPTEPEPGAWAPGPNPEPSAAWGQQAETRPGGPWPGQAWAGPSRHPAEPPPTLSVPFRVIRRGTAPVPERGPGSADEASAGVWAPAGAPTGADGRPNPAAQQNRPGPWPLRTRQQAKTSQAPVNEGPEDPRAVDRSWQTELEADW